LFGFIRKAIRLDGAKQDEPTAIPPVGLPILHQDDEEIPRYPPFMRGLPATPPNKLIETQRDLIGQIREAGLASPDIFEQFYLASLRRFASYAHLLPASQTHHHRGAGGLLRHAAEVALWSLQSGDRVLLPGEQAPRRRRELEPRWHYAVFLAALCHDAGKPVTDLAVTSRDGEKVWNPFVEDLYSWANRHGVDRYFLHWRENRAKKHTAISSLIAERIISQKGLAWIAEGDTELALWMMESINGNPCAENLIHDLVVRSDQVSVERDLRSLGVAFTGYELGLPVERFLVDIMRRLVREGTWGINEPGSRLWNIDGHLYLIWPAGGEEMAAIINQEKIPGLPRTPNSILDMLVDRKLANVREDQVDGNRYWTIAPAILAEKIPNIRLTAIRLRDVSLVVDPPPPSVPGTILGLAVAAPEIPVPKPPAVIEPAVTKISATITQSAAPDVAPPTQAADRLDGPVGEMLKALSEDIRSGEKSFPALAHVDASGALCLKWPDAFTGYGLEGKAILEGLSRKNWLVIDPLSPFRKIAEIEVEGGQKWKIVRLQPVVRQLMALQQPPLDTPSLPSPSGPANSVATASQNGVNEKVDDTRLELIQRIVATLREGVRDGILKPEVDGAFVWIQSRKAEPYLTERLQVERVKIMRLGTAVPDAFLCQTRKKSHYYRIPATPQSDRAQHDVTGPTK
jgi:conjugal transfer pilus assembly protein TraI